MLRAVAPPEDETLEADKTQDQQLVDPEQKQMINLLLTNTGQ
jgi:hypothetical protein